MIGDVDPAARGGDVVAVYDKIDAPYGVALYNPHSLIALRVLTRKVEGFTLEGFLEQKLKAALDLRRYTLKLDETTNVYRVVHDLGDGIPGLVVDRYGTFIALEFYSLGMYLMAGLIERLLGGMVPGAKFVRRASEFTQSMEGFQIDAGQGAGARTKVKENGVTFEVDLTGGHKTGFFCDQRENRLGVAHLSGGRRVLDVCSFTGGFGLYAKALGEARDVTCVELDPEAVAQARRNAQLNQVTLKVVGADAFPYMRQMSTNQEKFGLVVLDPYKLISSKENYREGRQKYLDFNKLALSVVEPGGFLVTCSCSGMLSIDEFSQVLRTAAGLAGRRVQVLRRTGAGPDHPVAIDHPEGEYLKVLWCRVE